MERKRALQAKSYKLDVIKVLREFSPRGCPAIPAWKKLKMGGNWCRLGDSALPFRHTTKTFN
jgi:hypothetical protein